MRWRLYSSSFYRLFFSFTLFILHLHTPSFLIIIFFISFHLCSSFPIPSSLPSFLVFILVSSPLPVIFSSVPSPMEAEALYSFRASECDELSFQKGDILKVSLGVVHCEHLDETNKDYKLCRKYLISECISVLASISYFYFYSSAWIGGD